MKRICLSAALLSASILILPASIATADVLVLKNGKSMKGIVEETANDTAVTFIGALGKQKIPKDRVQTIQKEPAAQGYIHIGDEYMRLEKPTEALAAYKQALKEDPKSTD